MYVHLKRNKYIILPFALVYTLSLVSQSIAIGSSLCQLQSLYNAHTQHKHLATSPYKVGVFTPLVDSNASPIFPYPFEAVVLL